MPENGDARGLATAGARDDEVVARRISGSAPPEVRDVRAVVTLARIVRGIEFSRIARWYYGPPEESA